VLTIHIANGVVRREDVTFELRPPQAR
jgi:hypothetical protein